MRQIENADASLIEAGLSIRDHLDLKEGQLRDDIAKKITRAFIIVNLGVLILILLGAILDHWFIAKQLI